MGFSEWMERNDELDDLDDFDPSDPITGDVRRAGRAADL